MIKQLEKFEAIVRKHAFKGILPPTEVVALEEEYLKIKKQTEDFIHALIPKRISPKRLFMRPGKKHLSRGGK